MEAAPCTKTVTPADAPRLQEILNELPEGAVVCLGEGRYEVQLFIERSITFRGAGPTTVLDGRYRAPVLLVARPDVDMTVENLVLRRGSGGAGGEGGNVSVFKGRKVVLRDVSLELGESESNGGGALMARNGDVLLERCTLTGNRGARAQAILIDGIASVTLRDCLVVAEQGTAPAALVLGGAQLVVDHTTMVAPQGAVKVRGSNPTRPSLVIDGSIVVSPPIILEDVTPPPRVTVRGSALSDAVTGIEDQGGNAFGELHLDAEHRPTPGSIAQGRGPRQ